MDPEQIRILANSINAWIAGDHPDITDFRDVAPYIRIFLESTEENEGEPLHPDAFRDNLWTTIHLVGHAVDEAEVNRRLQDFSDTWTAWGILFRSLRNLDPNRLRKLFLMD